MTDNGFIVQSAIPERLYVKVYHDFLDSTIVTGKEKLVFILLKRYLNFKYDESGIAGEVYPTLETLSKQAGMSRKTVADIIKKLETKGLIEIKQQGLNRPNIYTLKDFSGIWKSKTETELKEAVESYDNEEFMMIQKLRSKGYTVVKEKEPDKLSADQSIDNESSTNKNHICKDHNTVKQPESQVEERWSMERIKQHYDYDILLNQKPYEKDTIDGYMDLLYDLLNEKREYITISGNKIPVDIVWSRLEKLYYEHILYCMKQMGKQTTRIHSTKEYKKKLLYEAYTQMNDDISNQVQHDMHNWEPSTE